jgi:hypothetical protein
MKGWQKLHCTPRPSGWIDLLRELEWLDLLSTGICLSHIIILYICLIYIIRTRSCKFEAFKIPIEYLASLHYLSWLDIYEFELITWNLLSFLINIITNQSNSFWKLTVKQKKGRELQKFFSGPELVMEL